MAFTKAEEKSKETIDTPGDKKYGRLLRKFREGFLSMCIYKNVHEHRTFYDIVIYRKVKKDNGIEWVRGANMKPSDLHDLSVLNAAATEFFKVLNNENKLDSL